MKEIAILGPTASGKTSLAIDIASEIDAYILSLDSLSIYKEIDIISAKPTVDERRGIKHFGIDEYCIGESFNVNIYLNLYKKAKLEASHDKKNLIIVGGTSFYLKSIIDGLSEKIAPSIQTIQKIDEIMLDLNEAYKKIEILDLKYASKISSSDKYRIQKWYEIYFESGKSASKYFLENKKRALNSQIEIYEIETQRELLREKIFKRTAQMLINGAIDEVFSLEKKYTREPNPMKAIGIKEILEYLDGKYNRDVLTQNISIHTAQLAKRQETFNRSQFKNITKLPLERLKIEILNLINL